MRNAWRWIVCLGIIGWLGAVTSGCGGEAWASHEDGYQEAIRQASEQITSPVTAITATGAVIMVGGTDGTYPRRVLVDASGHLQVLTVGGTTSINTNQQTVSSSAPVPASALTGRTKLCVFNQDTGINLFCGDASTVTTSNGVMLEPRVGRCWETTEVIRCVAASGSVTIDFEEYAP